MQIEVKVNDRNGVPLKIGDLVELHFGTRVLGVAKLCWDEGEGRLSSFPCIVEDAHDFFTKVLPRSVKVPCSGDEPQAQGAVSIGEIGANLAMELIAERGFKPSGDGDFHCATQTNLLLDAACQIMAKQNAEDKLHALLRGFRDQIVKYHTLDGFVET
jgi:hypothetical protein